MDYQEMTEKLNKLMEATSDKQREIEKSKGADSKEWSNHEELYQSIQEAVTMIETIAD